MLNVDTRNGLSLQQIEPRVYYANARKGLYGKVQALEPQQARLFALWGAEAAALSTSTR